MKDVGYTGRDEGLGNQCHPGFWQSADHFTKGTSPLTSKMLLDSKWSLLDGGVFCLHKGSSRLETRGERNGRKGKGVEKREEEKRGEVRRGKKAEGRKEGREGKRRKREKGGKGENEIQIRRGERRDGEEGEEKRERQGV